MPADHQVEAAIRERCLLGIALLEADVEPRLRSLAPRQIEHRRGQIDPRDSVPPRRQFQAQKAAAAADNEPVERRAAAVYHRHDPVPGGTLPRSGAAVPKILVEMRRPPVPMRGDPLLYDIVGRHRRHYFSPVTSASASTCS